MTDQSQGQQPESENSATNVSGGVNVEAQRDVNIGGDAVGRDKTVSAGTYIEHYYAGNEAAPSKPKVHHNLPQPDYTRFVGRDRELAWLHGRLSPRDRAWQVAITGIGGVGKSALALAIAREYLEQNDELPEEDRFEAIIWISAKEEILTTQGRDQAAPSGLILRSLEDVYAAIAQTLDREDITRATSAKDQDRLVQKALSEYRSLLVMDNLESVTDERIKPFLRYLPGQTKAIITSREWVEVADVLPLRGLTPEEAEQLLIEEAAVRNVILSLLQRQRLVDLTSGLPLPLKLSVARIASGENFEAVTRWLGNAVGDVPEYCVQSQAELARQRDPNAWPLLLAASLFDRSVGASREALGYVADLSIIDRDKALTQLQRLFLVNRSDEDRFWLLPIVQRYAGAQFSPNQLGALIIQRWLDWLVDFGQKYGLELDLDEEKVRIFQVEYPNLRNAIRWCQEHAEWNTLVKLAEGTWTSPYLSGLFNECEDILILAVDAAMKLDNRRMEGKAERQLARLAVVQENYEDAFRHLDQAEKIARSYGDEAELGQVLTTRMDILNDLNRLSEAEEVAQAVFEMGKRLNDIDILVLAAYRFSALEAHKGNFEKATEWLDQSERWAKQIDAPRRLTAICARRGINSLLQGDWQLAEQFLTQALAMNASRGERRYMAYNNYRLAQIYAKTGRLQMAYQAASDARDFYARSGLTAKLVRADQLLREIRVAQQVAQGK